MAENEEAARQMKKTKQSVETKRGCETDADESKPDEHERRPRSGRRSIQKTNKNSAGKRHGKEKKGLAGLGEGEEE